MLYFNYKIKKGKNYENRQKTKTTDISFLAENDIIMPEGTINGAWFAEHDLPMIVSCTCCGMTMALPSAYVDEDGYTYCSGCAGED